MSTEIVRAQRTNQMFRWRLNLTSIAAVVLGVTALGATSSWQAKTDIQGAPPEFGAGVHETRADLLDGLQFPNATESSPQVEAFAVPPPTRGSFMATWDTIPGATGYLLDVSTSSSFSSYVDGYHDLNVGNVTGRVVTGLNPGTTYYYRVHPEGITGLNTYLNVMTTATVPTTGLTIHATFDSSITNSPNAAAIEAMISRIISNYESLFSDSITIQIRFRYATTAPDGTSLPQGALSQSLTAFYMAPWNVYIDELRADATTSNDSLAIASLPGSALSTNIVASSANVRAVGGNTPPDMFADGHIGPGGPYDGIITLNSSAPFQFTRPTSASDFDAQRATEHEIDEVMGLGSRLGHTGSDLHPQDLFSWSSHGVRNISSSGTRYFSINSGSTNIVGFNQDSHGDFGDWLSTACPQTHPYVQNAFACRGQSSDVSSGTPEGINLDVIGYDLRGALIAAPYDFNNDGHSDFLLSNAATRETAIWYLDNNNSIGSATGPTLPAGWQVIAVADFNRDGHPDYLLFNPSTRDTVIWHMNNNVHAGGGAGPTLPGGWSVVAVADFNGDGFPDYVLYNASTRATVIWYMRDNDHFASHAGPTLVSGWVLAGVADFNGDGDLDYLLFRPSTGQSVIWYLSGLTRTSSRSGPTIPGAYQLVGVADFDANGKPDYVLYNPSTQQTAIWYLNDNVLVRHLPGPTLPAGWTLVAP